jgi:ABC-type transporter Mla MlaB component
LWQNGPFLALDLAGVAFIDRAGVTALPAICRTARTFGESVRLAGTPPCMRPLVQNTKLQHVLGAMPAFTHTTRAVQGGATATKVRT